MIVGRVLIESIGGGTSSAVDVDAKVMLGLLWALPNLVHCSAQLY